MKITTKMFSNLSQFPYIQPALVKLVFPELVDDKKKV